MKYWRSVCLVKTRTLNICIIQIMLLHFKTLLEHKCLHNLSSLLSWMYILLNKAHGNAKLFCFQSDYVALPLIHVCTVTRCNGISCCFNVMNPVLPALKSCCWKWLHKTERLWLKPLQSFRTPAYCKKLFGGFKVTS